MAKAKSVPAHLDRGESKHASEQEMILQVAEELDGFVATVRHMNWAEDWRPSHEEMDKLLAKSDKGIKQFKKFLSHKPEKKK